MYFKTIESIFKWNLYIIGACISSYFIYLIFLFIIDCIKIWYNRKNFKPPF